MADQTQLQIFYGQYFVSCDTTTFPSVYFYIDGRYYEILAKSYITGYKANDLCLLGFMPGGLGSYILAGDVFLNSYYSIWDDDNAQVAFVPNLETTARILTDAAPTETLIPNYGVPFNFA